MCPAKVFGKSYCGIIACQSCAITPSAAAQPPSTVQPSYENYHFACQRLRRCFCWLSPCRPSARRWLWRRSWSPAAIAAAVEHHSHRAAVSRGAGESLSPALTGAGPAAENWDPTVRAVTSCFTHPSYSATAPPPSPSPLRLLQLLLLSDAAFKGVQSLLVYSV